MTNLPCRGALWGERSQGQLFERSRHTLTLSGPHRVPMELEAAGKGEDKSASRRNTDRSGKPHSLVMRVVRTRRTRALGPDRRDRAHLERFVAVADRVEEVNLVGAEEQRDGERVHRGCTGSPSTIDKSQ